MNRLKYNLYMTNTQQMNPTQGIVFYADGSAKPNPGTATFGVHGYSYKICDEKPPTFKYDFTTLGYKKKLSLELEAKKDDDDSQEEEFEDIVDKDSYSAKDPNKVLGMVAQENNVLTKPSSLVYPVKVYDIYGYVGENTNNNIAEIEAAKAAISCAVTEGFKHVDIVTDSISTVQCFNTWIYKWASNDWKKADGSPLKNIQYMQDLHQYLSDITNHGMTYKLHWIEGHAGHYGNERADQNAEHAHNNKQTHLVQRDSKSHFNFKATKPNFFNLPSLVAYLDSTLYNGRHVYISTNREKKAQLYGTKSTTAAYSVVLSKQPVPEVEKLLNACKRFEAHDAKYILVDLQKLYSKTAAVDVEDLGENAFNKTSNKSFIVGTAHCEDIAVQLDAPMMVHSVYKICNDTLNDAVDALSGRADSNTKVFEVTDQIFKTNDKSKTSVVNHFNHTDKTFSFNFQLFGKPTKETFVPGQDFPSRSVYKDLEGKACKVYLIVKELDQTSIWKYCFYTVTDDFDMLNIPGYANIRIKLTPEQQKQLAQRKKK